MKWENPHEREVCRGESAPADRGTWVWLAIVVAAGTWLRLNGLGDKSFWLDEVFSVISYNDNPLQILNRLQPDQLPLYHWIIYPFQRVTLEEGFLRIPSSLFGIVLLPLLFFLGNSVRLPRAGLAAAALAAFSPYLVHYSQEHRPYSLMIFISTMGTLAVLRFITVDRPKKIFFWGGLLVFSSVANLLTHAFSIFVVIIHWSVVGIASIKTDRLRQAFLLLATGVTTMSIPVFYHIFPMIKRIIMSRSDSSVDLMGLWPALKNSFIDLSGGTLPLAVVLAFLSGFGLIVMLRRTPVLGVISISLFAVPLVVISIVKPPYPYYPRYICYVLPHILILSAVALTIIWDGLASFTISCKRRNIITIFGPALIGLSIIMPISLGQLVIDQTVEKDDWRTLSLELRDGLQEMDLVLVEPFFHDNALLYYLDRLSPEGGRVRLQEDSSQSWYRVKFRRERELLEREEYNGPLIKLAGIRALEQAENKDERYPRIWLVTNHFWKLEHSLGGHFRPVWVQEKANPFVNDEQDTLGLYFKSDKGDER